SAGTLVAPYWVPNRHGALHKGRWQTMLCLTILLLAACGQSEIQSLSFNPAPWRAGEISNYQVTTENGATAGSARFTLLPGDPQNNPGGWSIQREIDSQGAQEIVIVEVDQTDFSPISTALTRFSSQGKESEQVTYNNGAVDIELTSVMSVTTNHHIDVPSDIRVEPTLAQLVRALPLATGYATRLNSFSPATGTMDRVTVQVTRQEQITVPAGAFDTWRVELKTNTTTGSVWIDRTAPHVLVKYMDGASGGTFELMAYKPGE
ncbi:MAG: DUF3108 domain-containing protein, partial [Chloroflexi bacterium]|nr:DUF3108 domain-containing protein [Chloroflexota bacterium]